MEGFELLEKIGGMMDRGRGEYGGRWEGVWKNIGEGVLR